MILFKGEPMETEIRVTDPNRHKFSSAMAEYLWHLSMIGMEDEATGSTEFDVHVSRFSRWLLLSNDQGFVSAEKCATEDEAKERYERADASYGAWLDGEDQDEPDAEDLVIVDGPRGYWVRTVEGETDGPFETRGAAADHVREKITDDFSPSVWFQNERGTVDRIDIDDEDHEAHAWGAVVRDRLSGTPLRRCTIVGCSFISLDLDDEDEDEDED